MPGLNLYVYSRSPEVAFSVVMWAFFISPSNRAHTSKKCVVSKNVTFGSVLMYFKKD